MTTEADFQAPTDSSIEDGDGPVTGPPVPSDVEACLRALRRSAGETCTGVIFFGSRLLQTSPDAHSAADLFVVVEDYGDFYRRLQSNALIDRSPRLLAWLNRWLPPNVMLLRPAAGSGAGCKCCVISREDLERELSPRSLDHFCKGRLTQSVAVVEARDRPSFERLEEMLATARQDSLGWVPAYLAQRFSLTEYCRTMLTVSFSSEIRPEAPERVEEVLQAQKAPLESTFREVLGSEAARVYVEELAAEDYHRRPGAPVSRRRAYFHRTQVRSTLRWVKHPLTFHGWLDYIVRKLNRRTGMEIELTEAERKWPLLLLWPKLVRVLRELRRGRRSSTPAPSSTERGGGS